MATKTNQENFLETLSGFRGFVSKPGTNPPELSFFNLQKQKSTRSKLEIFQFFQFLLNSKLCDLTCHYVSRHEVGCAVESECFARRICKLCN